MKKNKAVQGDTEYQTERGQQLHILWSRKASLRRRHLNMDLLERRTASTNAPRWNRAPYAFEEQKGSSHGFS